MPYYKITISLIAGICLGFGVLYLFIGLRRKDNKPLNLTFALFALCYATTLLNGVRWYSTTSLTEFITINRFDSVFVAGAFVALAWYVAYYTGVRPKIFLWILSAAHIAPLLLFIVSPMIIYGEVLGLTYIVLPWGENLADLNATGSFWFDIILLARLVTLGYIIFALIRQFWRGDRQPALVLGLGLLPFIIGILYEVLGESGAVPYFPAGEFGFLGIAVAASLQMANSVIRTEEELARHRQDLQNLVEARTVELGRSNEQLQQEVNDRRAAEQALSRRMEELAMLHQSAQTVARSSDLSAMLLAISEQLNYLFDVRFTHISVLGTDGSKLSHMFGYERDVGPIGPTALGVELADLPLTSKVISTGKYLAISNILSSSLDDADHGFFVEHKLQGVLLIPLLSRGAAIGLLSLATDQAERKFAPDEIILAETIAGDIAIAIENNRLLEKIKVSAAAEERNRLARDLHDSVTQTLYSAGLVAEALPQVWQNNPDEMDEHLTVILHLIRGSLAEMRTLLLELRPEALERADLATLLRQLGDALTGQTQIPVQLVVEGQSLVIPPQVKVGLFRMAQEIFNNISKHAHASEVQVDLKNMTDQVILQVQDNGRGFDPAAVAPGHMGLRIMQERASAIGATLNLKTRPGRGTRISISYKEQV